MERFYKSGRRTMQLVSCHTYQAKGQDQKMLYTLRGVKGTTELTGAQFRAKWQPVHKKPWQARDRYRFTSTRGERRRAARGTK